MSDATLNIQVVHLPCRRPFVTSVGSVEQRDVIVVCLSQDGVVGYGEASPLPGFSEETFDQALDALRSVASSPLARLPQDVSQVVPWLRANGVVHLSPSVRFALETALLDRCARIKGVSLANLLAQGDAATRVMVNATITGQSVPACFSRAMACFDEGYRVFKIKVGALSVAQDVARVRAVRDAVGDVAKIRLDANGAWGFAEAVDAIKSMSDFDIDFVEQPVATLDQMALVAQQTQVALAADEIVRSAEDLEQCLQSDAVDVVVLKPAMIGSILQTRTLAQRAHDAGRRVIMTTSLDGAIGRAVVAHLCASLPWLEDANGLATGGLFDEDLVERKDPISSGAWHLEHQSVGHGVTPKYIADVIELRAPEWSSSLPLPLAQRAQFFPAQVALQHGSSAMSYKALFERVCAVTVGLQRAGVRDGHRVAVWAKNSPQLATVLHAIMAMGAVVVPLHPGWTEARAKQEAARARVSLVVTEDPTSWQTTFNAMSLAQLDEIKDISTAHLIQDVHLERPAAILFTSGTTGQSKMVLLSWGNLFFSATGSAIRLGHLPSDRWLCVLPMCHIAGLSVLFRCVVLGTTAVVEHFDPKHTATMMIEGQISLVSLVPTMLREVLDELNTQPHANFRAVLLGGGAIDDLLLERCQQLRVPVSPTYGMTEGSSQLTTLPPNTNALGQGAGAPLLWTRIALDDVEDGGGRILAQSPTCSVGYLDEQMQVTSNAQWFDTGDIGRWAETVSGPRLVLLDRRVDLIVTGGENVSPQHVESVLMAHPSVERVCVVGMPSEKWGAQVEAVVVAASPIDEAEVLKWCTSKLASFEVPKVLHQWSSLPTSTLNKISRAAVRKRLQEQR